MMVTENMIAMEFERGTESVSSAHNLPVSSESSHFFNMGNAQR
jgi:hypothetical protein